MAMFRIPIQESEERLVVWFGPTNGVVAGLDEIFTDSSVVGVEEDITQVIRDDELGVAEHLENHRDRYLVDTISEVLQTINITDSVPPEEGKQYYELISVTGSSMNHLWLHPGVYRTTKAFRDFDHLKLLMGFTDENAELISNGLSAAHCNETVTRHLFRFSTLRVNEPENLVESCFITLVSAIDNAINSKCVVGSKVRYSVGGLLVDPCVAFRGISDIVYLNKHGDFSLATEIKTLQSWPEGAIHKWYYGSKSSQAYGALFSTHSPTFLLNQNEAKFFLIDPLRNGIYTYPEGDAPLGAGSTVFVDLICLCLLSADLKNATSDSLPTTPPRVPNNSVFIEAHTSTSVSKPPAQSQLNLKALKARNMTKSDKNRGLKKSTKNLTDSDNWPSLLTLENVYERSKLYSNSTKCQTMLGVDENFAPK